MHGSESTWHNTRDPGCPLEVIGVLAKSGVVGSIHTPSKNQSILSDYLLVFLLYFFIVFFAAA